MFSFLIYFMAKSADFRFLSCIIAYYFYSYEHLLKIKHNLNIIWSFELRIIEFT